MPAPVSAWASQAMALAAGTLRAADRLGRDCEFLGVVTTSRQRRRQVAGDLGLPAFASWRTWPARGRRWPSHPGGHPRHADPAGAAPGPGGRLRQPFRADAEAARAASSSPSSSRSSRSTRTAAGIQFPQTCRAPRRGELGTLTLFESRFERFSPSPGRPRRAAAPCWTSAATLPPGPGPRRPGDRRVRRDALPHRPGGLRRRRVHRPGPRRRRESFLWGSWRQGVPGPAVASPGQRSLCHPGRPGQEAQLRSGGFALNQQRPVGFRAVRAVGTPGPRRPQPAGALRTRLVGPVLPRLRRRGPR